MKKSVETASAMTPQIVRIGRAYVRLRNHGTWPGGDYETAAATFVDATEILDQRMARIDKEEADKARHEREQASRRARARRT